MHYLVLVFSLLFPVHGKLESAKKLLLLCKLWFEEAWLGLRLMGWGQGHLRVVHPSCICISFRKGRALVVLNVALYTLDRGQTPLNKYTCASDCLWILTCCAFLLIGGISGVDTWKGC